MHPFTLPSAPIPQHANCNCTHEMEIYTCALAGQCRARGGEALYTYITLLMFLVFCFFLHDWYLSSKTNWTLLRSRTKPPPMHAWCMVENAAFVWLQRMIANTHTRQQLRIMEKTSCMWKHKYIPQWMKRGKVGIGVRTRPLPGAVH